MYERQSVQTIVFFAALAIFTVPSLVAAQTVVYPTGGFPADLENVQAAVNGGGEVLLKATNTAGVATAFDFGRFHRGQGGSVFISVDAQLVGETVAGDMTTIRGGYLPVRTTSAKVRTRIQGIHFDAPGNSAIAISRSLESTVVGNWISDVVPAPLGGFDEARGIKFLGNSDPDGAVTGPVRIIGNIIENANADASNAIILDSINADVEIRANQIASIQGIAIGAIRSKGSIVVADNLVEPGSLRQGSGHGIAIVFNRGASI